LFFHLQYLRRKEVQSLKTYNFFFYYTTTYTKTGPIDVDEGSAFALALDAL